MTTPCRECKDRHVGCHSDCEKYKAYKIDTERLREKRFKSKESNKIYMDFLMGSANRRKR